MMTWKAVCFALSKRMIGILYGSNEGTDTVVLKIEDDIQVRVIRLSTVAVINTYAYYQHWWLLLTEYSRVRRGCILCMAPNAAHSR